MSGVKVFKADSNKINKISTVHNTSNNNQQNIQSPAELFELELNEDMENVKEVIERNREKLEQYMKEFRIDSLNYTEIEENGFTAQGYTIVEDSNGNSKIVISAYSPDGDYSRLYIYDEKTGELEGIIILDSKEHIGGVTYDKENGIIWVSDKRGKVNTYNYKKMLDILNESDGALDVPVFDLNDETISQNLIDLGIKIPNDIDVLDVLNADRTETESYQDGMDTIYYYNGKLYSCTYSSDGDLICSEIEYERDEKGNIIEIKETKEPYIVGKLNGAVQGMCFYEQDGKTYMITSSSAYFSDKSRLTKWEMTDDGPVLVGYIYINHPGLEGIEVKDGEITGVFEYNEQEVEVLGTIDDFSPETNSLYDIFFIIAGDWWNSIHNY